MSFPHCKTIPSARAAHKPCLCNAASHLVLRTGRRAHSLCASRFLGSQQPFSGLQNGTCRWSMRQRAFHFEVGSADDNTDEEQAFQEFSNLEKQTKIVDEQRRRRYFESSSDFKKRMTSQRFTTIRRARQDSWVQAYADVFEEEPTPFQDMFEQRAQNFLSGDQFGADGLEMGSTFDGSQSYSNGKRATQTIDLGVGNDADDADKEISEEDSLKAGIRKPAQSRAVAPAAQPAAVRGAPQKPQQVVASQPETKVAAAANRRSEQISDASDIADAGAANQGDAGSRGDAASSVAKGEESLVTNQFDTKAAGNAKGSDAKRSDAKTLKRKGFSGGKGPGREKTSANQAKPPQRQPVGAGR
ncbi:hypothetical protein WJX73_003866 [Symbiochloris irregularis]|uniref:Uncharacterized protein n=1 Tax=Symbiochloris irregularis TaxID=706552 RepID=A0AAW1NUN2_9CHLO